MAESETVVTEEEEPREVQVTERYVKRRAKKRRGNDRKGESSSIRKSFLSGLEVAPYVSVIEIVEHPDAAERQMPTFVVNRKIITGNQVRDRGLEATQEWIAEQWDEGIGGCYALRLCNKPNFSSTMKDPETERPFPDYTFTSGEMKVAAPRDELEDPELGGEDHYDDEIRDKGKRLRLAYLEKKIKRLEGRDEDEPKKDKGDTALALLIPILQEAIKPKPSFDVEAMRAIFSAQRDANAEMQKTMFGAFGSMMNELVKFKIDELRADRGLETDVLEDAPWFVKVGASVLEKVAATPAGQTIAARIGAPAAAAPPAVAAPPPTPRLPPPPPEAQARAAALSRFFLFIQQAGDLRPDPGVFVDKYLRNAFGMCAEADRVEVLGFLRQLRGGDYSGVEHLLQFFQSHRVPVRDFVLKVQAQPLLLHWARDVLLTLLDTHEPPPAEEPAAPAGTEAPKVNGTGEAVGPMGTGAEQEAEAPATTEEEPHARTTSTS